MQRPVFAVVIAAAGSGSRLGMGVPKALVEIAGKTLLEWALEGAVTSGVATRLVVTVPVGDTQMRDICARFGALAVEGGNTRAESVTSALVALEDAPVQAGFDDAPITGVLVHDAARCFTPPQVFHAVIRALAAGQQAVIPALTVVDTIKTVDASGLVTGTPARSQLRAVQTPQGFDLATLRQAHREVKNLDPVTAEAITDDAMLAETLNIPVLAVAGHPHAFKITTPLDLALARVLQEDNYL
nr:2-C-methyl-D-erythritol 4-phosphate cytidylyltransferase [Rothia sp. ZJ1223]